MAEWPALNFKQGEWVEVARSGRSDDPSGNLFNCWWPAKIVGVELSLREDGITPIIPVCYWVIFDGNTKRVIRKEADIRKAGVSATKEIQPNNALRSGWGG